MGNRSPHPVDETKYRLFEHHLRKTVTDFRSVRYLHHVLLWVAQVTQTLQAPMAAAFVRHAVVLPRPEARAEMLLDEMETSHVPGMAALVAEVRRGMTEFGWETWADVLVQLVYLASLPLEETSDQKARKRWAEQLLEMERALSRVISDEELEHNISHLPLPCAHAADFTATPLDAARHMVKLLRRHIGPRRRLLSNWEFAAKEAMRYVPGLLPQDLATALKSVPDARNRCVLAWFHLSQRDRLLTEVLIAEAVAWQTTPGGGNVPYHVALQEACGEVAHMQWQSQLEA